MPRRERHDWDDEKIDEDEDNVDEDTDEDVDDKENEDDEENEADYDEDDEEPVDEQPTRKKQRGNNGALSNAVDVPLYERLSALESSNLETASSTSAGFSSARKRLKQERKANSLRAASQKTSTTSETEYNKKSKNAPAEMRSNRPVRRLRENSNARPPKHADPRFSDLHGKLKHNSFLDGYKFLDQYQESEVEKLAKVIKKTKSVATREHLKEELGKRKQEMIERRRALKIRDRMRAVRTEERTKVAAGKKPFFLKESAKKALVLEERYEELKASGGGKLKKFIEKKRTKNAKKDIRWLPGRRDADE